jgi:hypothetical protein
MNCIDAVEGTVKCIITKLHQMFIEDRRDDTEYIRNVKAVMDATDFFIQNNREIVSEPQMLKHVLYVFSKELWLKNVEKNDAPNFSSDADNSDYENRRYYNYYYDYIYNHGTYPR